MILYDFDCSEHGRFEALVPMGTPSAECPHCHEVCSRVLSMPTIKLEGLSGAFPSAYDAWQRKHVEAARQGNKRKYGHPLGTEAPGFSE
jgi:putative FmdB family regulatory protein